MRAHHEKEMKENYFPSIVFNLCEKIESDTPLWAWKKPVKMFMQVVLPKLLKELNLFSRHLLDRILATNGLEEHQDIDNSWRLEVL